MNIKSINGIKNINDLIDIIYYYNDEHNIENNLHIETSTINFLAFYAKKKYKKFEIPKNNGEFRTIYAPTKYLKTILKSLNYAFQAIYKNNQVAHGFLPNKSVATNAKKHISKNYVFNMDLKDFFQSIHQARIWKMLQISPFNLPKDMANLLAGLLCYQYPRESKEKSFLPQGAPTSPIISNFICYRLDKSLLELAKKHNAIYTRYADDITFSSNINLYKKDSEFLQKIYRIINNEGFSINENKIRLQGKGYRQEVTGIIVNEKINVSKKYIKNLRALIYMLEKYGEKEANEFYYTNHAKSLNMVISGKLNYLKMIKGESDSTYLKLKEKFEKLAKNDVLIKEPNKESAQKTKRNPKQNPNAKHNPKALVDILRKFSQSDSPFKATVHNESNYPSYNGYDNFMTSLNKEWNEIQKDLNAYSYRLYNKLLGFLFKSTEELTNADNYKGWGESNVKIGWSSSEISEYCKANDKNNPFEYKLPDRYIIEHKNGSITTFGDICMKIFKYEIEFRDENQQFFKLIQDNRKKLGSGFNVKIDEKIQGVSFYSDTHLVSEAINKIFNQFIERKKYINIRVSMETTDEYHKFIFSQLESKCNKGSKEMLKEIKDGDFEDIKKRLFSLCDWSIEAKCSDGNFRINYLKSDNEKDIDKLPDAPEGFTHILRFYK
ncbi:hypothetical protein CCY99_08790 [Helicobacter sp. 16-1353]|uniref:reverse transcriptase family protein n=1 Tax=Helicobacter sp. 16-1353 TaxID=2004996 RepID=UPI000DCF5AD7|nr:reverse transcriptase family protein [Helicobacter sp. 16-1353]RAX51646.1 hypothetical protein CCY99_08790 [Helicobacter sp. 16-1353]